MRAGLRPDDYWHQTPATVDALLAAHGDAQVRAQRDDFARAYQAAQLQALAAGGKLKPIDHYLPPSPEERKRRMLDTFKVLASRGQAVLRKVTL